MESQFSKYNGYKTIGKLGNIQTIQTIQEECKQMQCHTQVYFDKGKGLNEADSAHFYHSYGDDCILNFPAKDILLCRVDPSDVCAVVTIKKCCASGANGIFDLPYKSNGFAVGDAILFDTNDPQILIDNLPKGIDEIRVVLNVVQITPDMAENYRRQLYIRKQLEEKDAEKIQMLQESLDRSNENFSITKGEKEELESKLVELEESTKEEANCLKQKILFLTEERDQFCTQNSVLKNELKLLEERLEESGKAKDCVARELVHYQEHYHAAIRQREELKVQLAQVQNAYNIISNAFFWKITKPFRVILDTIKGVIKRNRYTYLMAKGIKCLKENGVTYTWEKVQNKLSHRQDFTKVMRPLFTKEELEQQKKDIFPRDVIFSVLVPVYNTPEQFLHEMIRSVIDQTYSKWELCIADGSDLQHPEIEKICRQYSKADPRIKYKKLEKNLGISENTNACIKMATGDYVALLDHDDLLHPAALHEVMKEICDKNADFIYTDEAIFHDKPQDSFDYHFKSDYAPDTLRSVNYICHLSVFSKFLLNLSGNFRSECDGSQDFDLILRLTERAEKIIHIPMLLYYWRSHPNSTASDVGTKPYVIEAGHRALKDHLNRLGLKGEVLDTVIPTMYRIRYKINGHPKISIIIPNQDHVSDLKTCLDSIYSLSTYRNFEIIIIENGSKYQTTFSYYEEIKSKWDNLQVITWDKPFNYATINNYGVQCADGEYIVLLNNDTEIISPEWMEEMLMFNQRNDVGVVGAKLYYPDGKIQHAGVIIGIGSTAGHQHKGANRTDYGYLGRLIYAQNLSAVTGACMMVRKNVWDEVGGLDEKFVVAFNDVDICLRIRKKGYLVVWTPYAELYHYESKSRGYEDTPAKQERFKGEAMLLQSRWETELKKGDPYYNQNLTLNREDFSTR